MLHAPSVTVLKFVSKPFSAKSFHLESRVADLVHCGQESAVKKIPDPTESRSAIQLESQVTIQLLVIIVQLI